MMNNRYIARCIRASRAIKFVDFIVDTGARYSCCNYKQIDSSVQENELANCETKHIGGLIQGEAVKFYKYCLKQFTIGNIDMGAQDIWITFEERVTDTVLGMDILKQVIMIANPYDQRLYFCKDAEDYNRNFKLAAG